MFGAAADGHAPRFRIDTAKGATANATLLALDDAAIRIDKAGAMERLPDWIELRQEGRTLPNLLTRNFVILTNGDRLPLDAQAAAKLEGQRLHVWPDKSLPGLREKGLSLFAPNVVMLFWSLPDGVDDAHQYFARLQRESRLRDVAYLKNGDRIEGRFQSILAQGGCTLLTDSGKETVPWSRLAGVAWNTERQARLRTKNAYTRSALAGGARLNFVEVAFDGKTRRWAGKTQFGATLELPEESILTLDRCQGMAVELSALKPARYEHRPYLGAAWPLFINAAVGDQPLRVGGHTFESGLGMHAPATVEYKLEGKYRRFDAAVGVDPLHSRRGRVKATIEIDGKRSALNDGKEITPQTPAIEIRQDVSGARVLRLIVEVGAFGDVHANVNWANARLIK